MRSTFFLCAMFVLLLNSPAPAADQGHHDELSAAHLGAISFPISCPALEQKEFEQGVAWLHSFEYEQAQKQFGAITQADPQCGMAYWGQAMALYHQLWERPDKSKIKRGSDFLKKAKKAKKLTPRENGY